MKDLSKFQLALLGIFLMAALAGFAALALRQASNDNDGVVAAGPVVIWGTVPALLMTNVISDLADTLGLYGLEITYSQRSKSTYEAELLEGFATDRGPDLFMVGPDQIVEHSNKIRPVSYETFDVRRYKDTYVPAAELFLADDGIVAFPFLLDPLVMYWNRTTLTQEGIPLKPEFWSDFFQLSPKLTKRDDRSNILQATVALGEYDNITNAKAILSALFLQAGTPIVEQTTHGSYNAVLSHDFGFAQPPAVGALSYYTEFSNPIKSVYSWNRALPESRAAFLSGDLAFYFGFASEIPELRRLNPNLDFDVAMLPQSKDGGERTTFADITGLVVANKARNPGGAITAAIVLSSDLAVESFSRHAGLPPVSRRLLLDVPGDNPDAPIFYEAALIAKSWIDPDNSGTDEAFREMVSSVTSGRNSVDAAVSRATTEISQLIP